MAGITEEIASQFLGRKVNGGDKYDPSLLVRVPRFENRRQFNIDDQNLPFAGCDVWHAYEFSSLTENGVPVTRLLKLKYPCDSGYIVESKSLKLYLNSFNMSRFGKSTGECINICKSIIQKDLSTKLETDVAVDFIENDAVRIEIFDGFKNIMDFVNEKELKIEKFKEAPELLETEHIHQVKENYIKFDSLRSNCRVTHQPDFGDVFIYYRSKKHIKEDSLVRYLCSFRSEFHFHEECCEMIYKRLYDILDVKDKLFVSTLYTRRGGIDICPSRWSRGCKVEDVSYLTDVTKYARNGIKQ